jgi:predicted transcriptional regulator
MMKKALGGEPVSRFMTLDPVTVPAEATIRQFVDEYVYRYHHKLYPVSSNGSITGCIELADVKHVDPAEWDTTRVDAKSKYFTEDNSVSSETDALEAMNRMHQLHRSRMLVTKDGQVVGVLALKDLLAILSLKLELGDK